MNDSEGLGFRCVHYSLAAITHSLKRRACSLMMHWRLRGEWGFEVISMGEGRGGGGGARLSGGG